MLRILIADDDVLVREGIVSLLTRDKEFEVVGQASNGEEAVLLAGKMQPDVILMDIRMPKRDGISAMESIARQWPRVKILALTTLEEAETLKKSLQAGAHGYVLKSMPYSELADAIRCVEHGHLLVDGTMAPHLVAKAKRAADAEQFTFLQQLSERQREVFQLLGQGKTNEEIAELLCISEGTVKNHVSKILEVTGVRDRVQAALLSQKVQMEGSS